MYRQLAGKHPSSGAVFAGIGRCSLAMHEYDDAERALASAVRVEPRNADHRSNLAYCLLSMGRVEGAREQAEAALALKPAHPFALRTLAETHRVSGEAQRAYDTIAPTLKTTKHDALMLIYFARLAAGVGRHEEAVNILSALDNAATLPDPVRSALHFELGGVLDKLKRYDEAWASFEIANRLDAGQYNIAALAACVESLISAWTPARVASMPRA